ncbi:Rhomboid-related protein 2 [Armadillidium nasatum]|uniref:Rhomboid-related protein 2 n=1 Tax=Armadillidium nasatum TaxID=96803 RepID=A0A5N5TCT4_9CRUS|nr:Rhomboid-related protein 2 [Armadillidium nasatum]KAB7504456.1 Rhomboid-related protein 2 [Armadillidium nasatum]
MGEPITAYGPTPMDSPLIYNPERRYEAWRFLTYMFIHSGWLHILSNSIMQLIMGTVLELVHKWYRVSIIYILGVIGGCLASSLATPSYYLAGASGGVYALEYAYIGNLIIVT